MANRVRKSQIKTQTKHFEQALSAGDAKAAEEQLRLAVKRLDKAASKSTMHKRTAARKKSRLAKKLNQLKGQKR